MELDPELRDELASHKAGTRQAGPDAYVFPGRDGKRRDRNAVRERVLYPAIKRANAQLAERGLETIPDGSNRERPGELVGMDCFSVGRLRGTQGTVWQLTAIDVRSSYGWADLVVCPTGNPSAAQTSALARRVAKDLSQAGWALERVLVDNSNEFSAGRFHETVERLGARVTHIRSGRPQTNGHVERLHRTILEECWRPAFARYLHVRFTGLRRDLDTYLKIYNFDRVHHGRLTAGQIPADIVYGHRKMEAR